MSVGVEKGFLDATTKLGQRGAAQVVEFLTRYFDDKTRPGISMERLDRTNSKDVWSARVTQDLRAIVFRDGPDDYLLYVDHHDAAYAWAERRRIVRNKITNTIQVYPPLEEVFPDQKPVGASADSPEPPIFQAHTDDYLLSLGAPAEWLPYLRKITDHEALFEGLAKLPDDVAERLFDVANGKLVPPPAPVMVTPSLDPAIPSTDGSVVPDLDDLERLLKAPLATWIAFLHPSQRGIVSADFSGPAKVTGTAGTGKTVVALHRARHLARQGKRVLLTSFVTTLCQNVEQSLDLLCEGEERARVDVSTVHQVARKIVGDAGLAPKEVLDDEKIRELIERFRQSGDLPLGTSAMVAEWNLVIQAQGVDTWDDYRTANRAGRGTPLTAVQRKDVWAVFERVRDYMRAGNLTDWQGMCRTARELLESGEAESSWDAVIVDEVQDLSVQALRLVAALGGDRPNGLMVLGDGGQRIYAHRTSLRSAGIEVRGRARVLRINYRTTEEIRRFADRILTTGDDLDGAKGTRNETLSTRAGVAPTAIAFSSPAEQYDYIAEHVNECVERGVAPNEIAVFARTKAQLEKAALRLHHWEVPTYVLRQNGGRAPENAVQLVTMHRAKGLEFKMAVVIDASKDSIPNRYLMNLSGDDQDRTEFRERERQLLYVALTRARDEVLVTWVGDACEFLQPALDAQGTAA